MAEKNMRRMKKECYFLINQDAIIDYKNVALLSKFVSSFGKIVARKRSGVSAKYQRKLAQEIKRARFMGLLPYVQK
jgi:small subunit ribosomal protein S18